MAVLDGSVAAKDGGSASPGGSKDPAQTGLVISSTPKAQIYLDGADKGSTRRR